MRKDEIHILLADDDVQNSLLLKRFLELEGYSVTYASDGVAAWEMYGQQHPDLILLDARVKRLRACSEDTRDRQRGVPVFPYRPH